MLGPRRLRCHVVLVAAVALGVWVAAAGLASGGPNGITVVPAGPCKFRVQSFSLKAPDAPPGTQPVGQSFTLELRVSRTYSNYSYWPDPPLDSPDQVLRYPLSAIGDLPSTVRLTAARYYQTSSESRVRKVWGRTVSAAIHPRGCTAWRVRGLGALATRVSWTTSKTGRTRSYGVRVRCTPAFHLVTIRQHVDSRPLATGRCNRTIKVTRPAAEATKRGETLFPRTFVLQAASSRSTTARHTAVMDCGSFGLPLKKVRPPHGRFYAPC